jgi:hypothetical protein
MVLDIQTVQHILKNTAVQNVNKPFVYITDLTSFLIRTTKSLTLLNTLKYALKCQPYYVSHIMSRGVTLYLIKLIFISIFHIIVHPN